MSRVGFLASSPIDVTDSKPTRIRIAMQAWMTMYEKAWGAITDPAVVWYWNWVIVLFGSAGSGTVGMAPSGA